MKDRRNGIITSWLVVGMLVAALVATAVLAQRGPNGPGRPIGPSPRPRTDHETDAQGVFVLIGGALTKYNANLEEQGSLRLLNPPTPPTDNEPPMPPMPRPGGMLIAGNRVVVLIADQVYLVDAARLTLAATVRLPKLDMPQPEAGPGPGEGDFRPMPPMGPPPVEMELQGKTLYILRAHQVLAIDIQAGKLVAAKDLPKPQLPNPAN